MPRKAFIVVPVSCLCETSLSKADSLFVPDEKIRYEVTRAGSINRNYDLPVYKLLGKDENEQTYYVQVQFATPILTMYEMYTGQIAGLRQQELYHQMHLFCYYLRSILRHSQTRACHDKAIIICYDQEDKEANLLSRLVRDRIKREIDFEEEAIQNRADTKPISESLGVTQVTFEQIPVSDLSKGRPLLQRYAMKESPKGKAIILSVRRDRRGTRADEEILQQLLKYLEFEVDLRIDPTAREMEDALASIQTVDHSQYTAFVCCILAHGSLGTVNGSGNATAKITDLTRLLTNDVCPGLAGKPKMFFIQACQSDREDSADRRQQSDRSRQTDSSVEHDASLAGNRANLVPGAEDFLMSYATLPGFKAYRNTENGTLYINSLNEKIREHRKERDMDLESILKLVSSQVQSKIKPLLEASPVKEEQCPFYLATMNKLIFL